MPIHTQDYRHWEGTLNSRPYTRWWIITKAELRLLAQRKIVRLIVAIPPPNLRLGPRNAYFHP